MSPTEHPEGGSEFRERERQKIARDLRGCLDDWSDEIPLEIVSSLEGQKYKVRNAWFTLVHGYIEIALDFLNDEIFTEEIITQLDPVIDTAREHAQPSEGDDRRNTREQIETCNALLKKVLDRLSSCHE